jgi:uncharacterized protein
MEQLKLIENTVAFVKQTLEGAEAGHDWWHVYRVWNLAKRIAENETCNLLVVELGALLHDIADSKFHDGNEDIGPRMAEQFLHSQDADGDTTDQVLMIIRHISFKGGSKSIYRSVELDIVQDADRLDAMGAIGIARAFNYGGFKNRKMYIPGFMPQTNMSPGEYKNSISPTLNHFHEKLFLLKDLMNTRLGKQLAAQRHQVLTDFYNEFLQEWEGLK